MYIIETDDHLLYTGITTDIDRRFSEHKSSVKGAKFFRGHKADRIVYRESGHDRSSASKREYAIKRLSKKDKIILTKQYDTS